MTQHARAFRLTAARLPLAHALHGALDALGVPVGAPIVLAVSGGRDSMALLGAAAGLVARERVQPTVAHVDHGLRPGSAGEGDRVADAAARAGLPVARLRVDVAPGGNVSARARAARYGALARHARDAHASWVATAHHASDQFETMLMALGRGAGIARLAGMRPARGLARGVRLIRPFLAVRRSELEHACIALDLAWCEDPGNADESRPRGAVRHQVAPVMGEVWPGCAARAARTAETLRWAADHLEAQAAAVRSRATIPEGLSRAVLRAEPLPVVAAVVRAYAGDACNGARAWQVAEAIKGPVTRPRTWDMAPGVRVRLTARYFCSFAVISLGVRQR